MKKVYLEDKITGNPFLYKHRVFFALGNAEVHNQLKLLGYSDEKLEKLINAGFNISTLLSDLSIQPTSHYYVPETRKTLLASENIFKNDYGIFVLGEDATSYEHDVELKKIEYPSRDDIFRNEQLLWNVVNEFNSFGPPLHRRGSVGYLTGVKWQEVFRSDITVKETDIVEKMLICPSMKTKEKSELIAFLPQLPSIRGSQAFDWDYVYRKIKEKNFSIPKDLLLDFRRVLLHCYLSASAELYNADLICCSRPERNLYPDGHRINRYDVPLFIDFAKILGINDIISGFSAKKIIEIKKCFEAFAGFRDRYFEILDNAREVEAEALHRLKEEAETEKEIETKQIRAILESSKPLLVECAKELGICKNPSVLYYPKDDDIYLFKKTLINFDDIPFLRFRDELIYNFSQKLKDKTDKEIYEGMNRISYYSKCHFYRCQYGNDNICNDTHNGKSMKPSKRRRKAMSKFVFHGKNIFKNCQFGDQNSLNNYIDVINANWKSPVLGFEIKDTLIQLRRGIDTDGALDTRIKELVVDIINRFSDELTKKGKNYNKDRLQDYWNQIKEGVKTSYYLTGIVLSLGKLLGWA